ncbi:MAG TPA: GNAT family N-acetyltransferase [Opitutaceae bacterium]|nr:GNAT family N-acetyltransferase [Opitutaceae bacterium]
MRPPELAPATPAATLECLTDPERIETLRDEWLALWRADPRATPFQSPDWLLPWYSIFGAEHAARVFVQREEERLVGVAAFALERATGALRFAGCGVSDYLDATCAPEHASAFAALLWRRLAREPAEWEWIELDGLRGDSPLLAVARGGPSAISWIAVGEACPTLALEVDGASPGWRHKLAYDWRRLARTGLVAMETANALTLPRLLATLFRLHTSRWLALGDGGVLAEKCVRRFHELAAPALLAHGILRLHCLAVEGVPVACYYGFRHAARAYYYLGGFDPAWQRHGVGNLVVDYAQRRARDEGAAVFDFLRGREPYKYRWGAHDEQVWTARVRTRAPAA